MDPILSALDKLRDELGKAVSSGTFRPMAAAAVPAVTEPFTFTDPESMVLDVHALAKFNPQRVLSLNLEDPDNRLLCAHLSQDAVNALARYLDQHRTDVAGTSTPGQCLGLVHGEECAGTRGHGGPCAVDADDILSTQEVAPSRCESMSPNPPLGGLSSRCELNDGHTDTHRYCGAEWGNLGALATDTPAVCPWGYRSIDGSPIRCDLTAGNGHVMHSTGVFTWGEDSPIAVRLHTVSDACHSWYSNAGRDDDNQPCEKPLGHYGPHRAESEVTSYVWTDRNPRAYTVKPIPVSDDCAHCISIALDEKTPEGS